MWLPIKKISTNSIFSIKVYSFKFILFKVLSAKDGPTADSMHGEALQKIAYLEKKQMNINLVIFK